jgi:hypothetical protein
MIKQINLLELFCSVDDFCRAFEPQWSKCLIGKKPPQCELSMSEVITILILFQFSGFKAFKYFYFFLLQNHKNDFPRLLSYSRFVEIKQHFLVPLISFMNFQFVPCTDISYIDSTPLKICHNKRIYSNKVFKDLAKRGKSTMGWFFGFKLHITANEKGELLSAQITKGNIDDRKVVPLLCKKIKGRLFGDKGYISQKLFEQMLEKGLRIITALRTKMKPKLMVYGESELLKKRSMIESVFHILKDILLLNHTRHRSPINFMVNIIGALCAYGLYPGKPAIKMNGGRTALPAVIFS